MQNTKIELALQQLLRELGYNLRGRLGRKVRIQGRTKVYRLRPDVLIKKVFVEADGPWHFSRNGRRITKWRDALIVASGRRVVHIHYRVLRVKKYHEALKSLLSQVIEEGESVVRIDRRNLQSWSRVPSTSYSQQQASFERIQPSALEQGHSGHLQLRLIPSE